MSLIESTWDQLWAEGAKLALQLQPFVQEDTRQLWIPALDIQAGLTLGAAALHLGLDPLCDEKAKQPPSSSSQLLVAPAPFYTEKSGLVFKLHGTPPAAWREAMSERTVWFSSSGSTGEPKPIARSMLGLLPETAALRQLHQVRQAGVIVSLVRPFHIYGFLHALLLALEAAATVVFWPPALPTLAAGFPAEVDLLVIVPAHWRLTQCILDLAAVAGVVTSGAAFGPGRGRELLSLARRPARFIEILGSTETGGIGLRRVGEDLEEDAALFTLFAGVSVDPGDETTTVHSPFLAPELSVATADRLEPIGQHHFRHLGRSDRVFKYAGVRYSLSEVEAALSRHAHGAAVVCAFAADAHTAQGGVLQAWIEAETVDVAKLREQLAATTSLPFPQLVHAVAVLPRDAQGKISLHFLTAKAQRSPS